MNASTSTAEQAHHSDWMDHAIRVGLVAYGVVHLLVGWLALQLAFGEKEDSASNSGALHYLAGEGMNTVYGSFFGPEPADVLQRSLGALLQNRRHGAI